MNFNWKEFEEGRILVHCNTEEETLDFLNKCRERGYQIHINEYNEYKKNTYYICYYDWINPRGKYTIAIFLYSKNYKTIDWKIEEEPKTYKAWELKEGKIYKRVWDDTSLYRVTKEGVLEEYNERLDTWYNNYLQYNAILNWLFYEVNKEIDWSKIPKGTKVQVRDKEEDKWENRYFISFNLKNKELPYKTSSCLDDNFSGYEMQYSSSSYKYCRIHPSVTIPNEWYKD